MSNSCHSPSFRWISVGDDHPCWRSPKDFFVASHWLERSSCRFAVTLLVFSRADHSTSQVLTTSCDFLWQLWLKACFKTLHISIRPPLIGSRPWCHMPRLIVMHVLFRSLLTIFKYAAKQHASSCSAIRPNYHSQPQLMLHIHRALG